MLSDKLQLQHVRLSSLQSLAAGQLQGTVWSPLPLTQAMPTNSSPLKQLEYNDIPKDASATAARSASISSHQGNTAPILMLSMLWITSPVLLQTPENTCRPYFHKTRMCIQAYVQQLRSSWWLLQQPPQAAAAAAGWQLHQAPPLPHSSPAAPSLP